MREVLFVSIFTVACTFCQALGAEAKEFCVSTSTELQAALTEAQANGEDDSIRIVQGIYSDNFQYSADENETKSIIVEGGYAAGCSSRTVEASFLRTVVHRNQSVWVRR